MRRETPPGALGLYSDFPMSPYDGRAPGSGWDSSYPFKKGPQSDHHEVCSVSDGPKR